MRSALIGAVCVGVMLTATDARGERPPADPTAQGTRGKRGEGAAKRGDGAQKREGRPRGAAGKRDKGNSKRQPGKGGEQKPGKTKGMVGNMFLKQGSPRAAIESFEKQLVGDPDSAALHVGLGRALAKIGRCSEALDHFWPYVGTVPFGGDSALAAATCSSRLGLLDDAVYFDRIAVDAKPKSPRILTSLALDLDSAGDAAGRDEVLEDLLLLQPDRDASHYARAVLALRRGDLETFDSVVFAWEEMEGPSLDIRRLQALSWLDQGNPVLAFRTLEGVRKLRNGQQVRHLRSESLRRMGYVDEAAAYLEDRAQSVLEGVESDAVKVLVYVDQGQLAEAHAVFDEYEGQMGADMLASAWYLARAEGRSADMPAFEAEYIANRASPLRELDHLVPWAVFPRP